MPSKEVVAENLKVQAKLARNALDREYNDYAVAAGSFEQALRTAAEAMEEASDELK